MGDIKRKYVNREILSESYKAGDIKWKLLTGVHSVLYPPGTLIRAPPQYGYLTHSYSDTSTLTLTFQDNIIKEVLRSVAVYFHLISSTHSTHSTFVCYAAELWICHSSEACCDSGKVRSDSECSPSLFECTSDDHLYWETKLKNHNCGSDLLPHTCNSHHFSIREVQIAQIRKEMNLLCWYKLYRCCDCRCYSKASQINRLSAPHTKKKYNLVSETVRKFPHKAGFWKARFCRFRFGAPRFGCSKRKSDRPKTEVFIFGRFSAGLSVAFRAKIFV